MRARLVGYARRCARLVRSLWAPPGGAARSRRGPVFPKAIFHIPATGAPAPDGQSLAYLQLARSLWLASWAGAPARLRTRIGRAAHDTVQRAHVLERRLLELTKGEP